VTAGIDPNQIFGYDVVDSDGQKIGSVDNVWVDDATNDVEFAGVHTGLIFGKTHVVPLENAQVDPAGQTIQVPFDQDQVKNAPSFGSGDELSPEDEDTIYSYYGMSRSTAASPSGLGTDAGTANYGTDGIGTDQSVETTSGTDTVDTGVGEERIQLAEEELAVGKQQVQAGQVRLRKVVRAEQVEQPVELRREDVEIERVPVSDSTTDVASDAFQEREIDVPLMREEPVVEKQARVTGEVRVGKEVETETRNVQGQVRSEDVEVDRDVDEGVSSDYTDMQTSS
jgi:uncharacterized protein (TIGR02271 family)